MNIARNAVSAGLFAGLAALAACQTAGPGPAATSVDGQWMSSDGVAMSTFSGGTFTTTATDTGNKLAEGSYVVSGATVQIIGTSVIRQTPVSFNCTMAGTKQLNCASNSGQNFTLVRRA